MVESVAVPVGIAEEVSRAVRESESREQLVALMNKYQRPLYSYLRTLVGDSETAFDCAQDAFVRAYENLVLGRTVNGQWLYKVARNRAIDHLRRKAREKRDEGIDQIQTPESESAVDAAVQRTLSLLLVSERELLYLAAVDRFKTDEIAEMLGIRPGAVRVRLFRARERFKSLHGGKT